MKVLVTGSGGFLGMNLIEHLKRDSDIELLLCKKKTPIETLRDYCRRADFVYHFAGVNRPDNKKEFWEGNFDYLKRIIEMFYSSGNFPRILFTSSIQAELTGRFSESEYGRSKKEAELILEEYSKKTGADVYVYRLPGVFGKWCKPNYNSVVATFCNNIANDLPLSVNDPDVEITIVYIDDVVKEFVGLLSCNIKGYNFLEISLTYSITVGELETMVKMIGKSMDTGTIPLMQDDSLVKKIYSTFLSYLPEHKTKKELTMHEDNRGSFTEIIKTIGHGQFSVNVSKPGITKGKHWHNSKWEIFCVVSGEGLIRERSINDECIREFKVSGEKMEMVYMLPGFTHEIINTSDKKDLVTLMWANEMFDKDNPDTYFEEV